MTPMKNFGTLLLFIISTTILPGCKPVKVVDYRPGVQAKTLAVYKTFNFYQLHVSGNKGPNFETNFDICKKAISSQMTSRGFTEVTDSGDLSINIGILLQVKNQNGISDEMQYMSEPNYTWTEKQESQGKLKVGTITIEMVDTNKKQGLWIGAISGIVPPNEAAKQKRINYGVTILFEKFPVKVK
jgi:Domain of unknown function (DUF4136)